MDKIKCNIIQNHNTKPVYIYYDNDLSLHDIQVFKDGIKELLIKDFRDGDVISMSSFFIKIVKEYDKYVLYEPNYNSFPIQWTRGITATIDFIRKQKYTEKSFTEYIDCTDITLINQSCIIGIDIDHNTKHFFMDRAEHKDSDSGWFIGDSNSKLDYSDINNLKRVSIFEVMQLTNIFSWFINFPIGYRIEFFKKLEDLVVYSAANEILKVQENSFLKEMISLYSK